MSPSEYKPEPLLARRRRGTLLAAFGPDRRPRNTWEGS